MLMPHNFGRLAILILVYYMAAARGQFTSSVSSRCDCDSAEAHDSIVIGLGLSLPGYKVVLPLSRHITPMTHVLVPLHRCSLRPARYHQGGAIMRPSTLPPTPYRPHGPPDPCPYILRKREHSQRHPRRNGRR